jgi:hypothetical protein
MPQDRLEQWSRYVRAAGIDAMFVGEEWEDYLSTQVYALGLCLSLLLPTASPKCTTCSSWPRIPTYTLSLRVLT